MRFSEPFALAVASGVGQRMLGTFRVDAFLVLDKRFLSSDTRSASTPNNDVGASPNFLRYGNDDKL